jgi:hypothetical protein
VLMVGLVGQGIILGVMVGVAYYQLPQVSSSTRYHLHADLADSRWYPKSEEFDFPIDPPSLLLAAGLL